MKLNSRNLVWQTLEQSAKKMKHFDVCNYSPTSGIQNALRMDTIIYLMITLSLINAFSFMSAFPHFNYDIYAFWENKLYIAIPLFGAVRSWHDLWIVVLTRELWCNVKNDEKSTSKSSAFFSKSRHLHVFSLMLILLHILQLNCIIFAIFTCLEFLH